jgi:hypothetical protein
MWHCDYGKLCRPEDETGFSRHFSGLSRSHLGRMEGLEKEEMVPLGFIATRCPVIIEEENFL